VEITGNQTFAYPRQRTLAKPMYWMRISKVSSTWQSRDSHANVQGAFKSEGL